MIKKNLIPRKKKSSLILDTNKISKHINPRIKADKGSFAKKLIIIIKVAEISLSLGSSLCINESPDTYLPNIIFIKFSFFSFPQKFF